MTKRSRVVVGICALVLGLRFAIESDSRRGDSASPARVRRAVQAVERAPARPSPPHDAERRTPPPPPRARLPDVRGREELRPPPDPPAARVAEVPEVRDAEPPGEEAAVADREAETGPEETPGRRKHDGDLGRAALKSEHLRDRSQASLGGGDLVELGESLSPGQPLSEAALDTRHLRDRTRESLGGADLGDLGSSEPGNLGARSLPAGNLRDLSRGEDDRGDFADRSSAR